MTRDVATETYRRYVLPLILQLEGRECLHASAVRTGRGVVAFCGASGAGKSTIAAGLNRRGFPPWADDVVVVDVEPGSVQTLTLGGAPRLKGNARAAVDRLPPAAPSVREEAPPPRLPLLGIVALTRAPGATDTSVERLESTAAFPLLLEHAVYFSLDLPGARRRLSDRLLTVAAEVPMLRCSFTPDFERFPALIEDLVPPLDELGSSPRPPSTASVKSAW